VQSALGNRLVMPPAMVRVTVRDRDARVATAAAAAIGDHLVEDSGTFTREKIAALEQQEAELEDQAAHFRRLQGAGIAAAGSGSEPPATAALVGGLLSGVQADLADVRGELASTKDLEQASIVDTTRASRVTTAGGSSSPVLAALVGALVGFALAVALAAVRRSRAGAGAGPTHTS
jgi:hypothetical protein